MEIAFFVIAALGLLALTGSSSGGGAAGAVLPPHGTSFVPIDQAIPDQPPWQPSLPTVYQPPMVPSTSSNVTGTVMNGGAQIGTQVASQALKSSGAIAGVGLTAATAGIAAGVGIIVGLATSLLQAHAARLKGAKNENQAVDQYIPVFDDFVKQVTDAYNQKKITAAQCAQVCQQFDKYLYSAFRGLVGAPGTSWSDNPTGCNKQCTVGCCFYFYGLSSSLQGISKVLGFPTTGFAANYANQYLISGRTVKFNSINPGKYSSFSRPVYYITLK